MNIEKLKKLQAQVRIGGKGTPRRKKKVLHQTPGTDDKKLQSVLKKIAVNPIPGIEEVNMIKNDGTVIHFNNPKAAASLAANTFAITGHGEQKQVSFFTVRVLCIEYCVCGSCVCVCVCVLGECLAMDTTQNITKKSIEHFAVLTMWM